MTCYSKVHGLSHWGLFTRYALKLLAKKNTYDATGSASYALFVASLQKKMNNRAFFLECALFIFYVQQPVLLGIAFNYSRQKSGRLTACSNRL
ncbi:hypothetical protein [Paenibacillus lautus]|uniref:hypothetical protein n=1 Tax=Paenibacillus lautus TaxID=1401 RepID=UPI001C7E0FF6|nr:hypothetical protein [Paenibacillus lautus]